MEDNEIPDLFQTFHRLQELLIVFFFSDIINVNDSVRFVLEMNNAC